MSKEKLNIDPLEKNQEKLHENTKLSIKREIDNIKKAKENKALESRIKALEEEIVAIKKFIAEDGYTKKIEEFSNELEKLEKIKIKPLKGKPTLVDFWADWCAPCRMIGAVVHQLRDKYKDELNVIQIDTETQIGGQLFMTYAKPYGVNAIPYLIVFDKDGNLFETLVGANPPKLTQMVEAVLKK
ncbi:MAG: thioredoxin fold domain-containing protein [Candidatus Helarchaeota archaeon]|nr:thioredoxin fold domain-containing protein [Candidatus Helarchaeota archaeon]